MDTKYKKGNIVKHVTNAKVKLVVINVEKLPDNTGFYTCSWIDESGRQHTENFHEFELKSYSRGAEVNNAKQLNS
jgi:uncharacterized protein YodC (DUF2158 family)